MGPAEGSCFSPRNMQRLSWMQAFVMLRGPAPKAVKDISACWRGDCYCQAPCSACTAGTNGLQAHLRHSGPAAGAPDGPVPPDATLPPKPIMPPYAALSRNSRICSCSCTMRLCGGHGLHTISLNEAVPCQQQGCLNSSSSQYIWLVLHEELASLGCRQLRQVKVLGGPRRDLAR